jgi:peptidoglycan hydrolase-like protein with peptidoglycan-binding domain
LKPKYIAIATIIVVLIALGYLLLKGSGSTKFVSDPKACVNNSLSLGATGSCVKDLQNMLNWSIYGIDGPNYKKVTGDFDSVTAGEVKSIQAGNNIAQTSSLNQQTWKVLCEGGSNSDSTWTNAATNAGCKL